MSTLVLDSHSTVACEPANDALILRISGGGLDGRVVRLASAKCTVGAGPRCTLRLLGAGIRPLHCLIVQGSRGTFVRRWSPDTLLNGRSFEDATLHAGDRLSVGPLELEILQQANENHRAVASAELVTRPAPSAVPTIATRNVAGQESSLLAAHTQSEIARLSDDVRTQISSLRGRARRLVEALRNSRQQQQELESRVQASLFAQKEAERGLHELSANARESDERCRGLQATVAELKRQISDLNAELDTQRKSQRELTEQLELAQSREAALKVSALAEGVLAAGTPTRADDELLGEGPLSADSNADKLAAIARLRSSSLWSERESVDEEQQAAHGDGSTTRSRAPVSFIEQYAPHLLEQDPVPDTALPAEARKSRQPPEPLDVDAGADTYDERKMAVSTSGISQESRTAGKAPKGSSPQGDDDESLEDYMAKLMQRVRGPDQPRPASAPKAKDPRFASAPTVPVPREVAIVERKDQVLEPFRLEDVKRVAPPERGGGFEAMRELANQSAHRAISKHRTERGTRDTIRRFLASTFCLASGSAIFILEGIRLNVAGLGGAAAILASAYFAARGLGSLLVVIRTGSEPDEAPHSEEATTSLTRNERAASEAVPR